MKHQKNVRPIDTLERFDFGGPPQWALVRGRDASSPVLLLIQAGPGLMMISDADGIEQRLQLEERFRVVYWDQRGTGKSFDSKEREPISLETSVSDARAMIRALCQRFEVSQVDVVGFSFGATVGLLACEDESLPVRSLTCVGVDVNLLEAERLALAFALAEAEERGNKGALRALRALGEPPHADTKRFVTRAKWVFNFGGVHRDKDFNGMVKDNLVSLWKSPHYGLSEMIGALRALTLTTERLLPGLQGLNLLATPLRGHVPVSIFQGRLDKAAPPELAASLAQHLGVDVVWFEHSAHVPHEEEPARFREQLLRFISAPGARAARTPVVGRLQEASL